MEILNKTVKLYYCYEVQCLVCSIVDSDAHEGPQFDSQCRENVFYKLRLKYFYIKTNPGVRVGFSFATLSLGAATNVITIGLLFTNKSWKS